MIIFILVYILSIVACKYVFLLHSSRYLDLFDDEDCTANLLWFLPIFNSFMAIILFIFGLISKINKKKISNFINWLCNYDLLKNKPF